MAGDQGDPRLHPGAASPPRMPTKRQRRQVTRRKGTVARAHTPSTPGEPKPLFILFEGQQALHFSFQDASFSYPTHTLVFLFRSLAFSS